MNPLVLKADAAEARRPREDEHDLTSHSELTNLQTGTMFESTAVGSYLSEVSSCPMLKREQEVALARRIRQTRTRICSAILSCNEVLDAVIDQLERIGRRQLRLDWYLELAVTETAEKKRIYALLEPTIAELRSLREENKSDFRIAISRAKSIALRRAAWRRIVLRRQHGAELIERLKFRMEHVVCLLPYVEETNRKMKSLQALLKLKQHDCNLGSARAVLKRELDCLMLNALDSPATRGRRLKIIHRHRQVYDALRQRFACSNLRFVVSVAKQYQQRGLSLFDLIQEGNLGLMRAIDKFNPELGNRFTTYAEWWIRQSVKLGVARAVSPIHVPHALNATVRKIRRVGAQLTQRLGREPFDDEIAKCAGITEVQMQLLMRVSRMPLSLSQSDFGVEGLGLIDLLENRKQAASCTRHLMNSRLMQALRFLNPRERRIIELRYGLHDGVERTLQEIGQKYSVSREYIRQVERRALNKLRNSSCRDTLLDLI